MTDFDYKRVLIKLIAEELEFEGEILPGSRLVEDLGADSLDMVELIMSVEEMLEKEFGKEFKISDEEVEGVMSVQDAYDLVSKLLQNEGAAA